MSEKKHELINQGAGGEKQALGRSGEYKAIQYLDQNGYIILCRNYRCRLGEIDIIASEGKTICFVEVKTRKNLNFGHPFEAIDEKKYNQVKFIDSGNYIRQGVVSFLFFAIK